MGYFDKFKNEGVPFMEGRTAGNIRNELLGTVVQIEDYGFIKSRHGETAVLKFKGIDDKFYFGNPIIRDLIREVEADGKIPLLKKAQIVFTDKVSKDGQSYTNVDVFEEGEEIVIS